MTNGIYWLLLLGVWLLIEIFTLGMTAIWFAAGSLAAFVISLFYDNLFIETVLFLLISLALLFTVKPLVIKYFHPQRRKSGKK